MMKEASADDESGDDETDRLCAPKTKETKDNQQIITLRNDNHDNVYAATTACPPARVVRC